MTVTKLTKSTYSELEKLEFEEGTPKYSTALM